MLVIKLTERIQCVSEFIVVLSVFYTSFLLFQVTLVDEEGSVFIKWVDKTLSKVKPQELYKIDAEVRRQLTVDFSN